MPASAQATSIRRAEGGSASPGCGTSMATSGARVSSVTGRSRRETLPTASVAWRWRVLIPSPRVTGAEARPAEFSKVVLPQEKKLLEQVLEASLGVSRKKSAAKRAPAKRTAKPKKKELF